LLDLAIIIIYFLGMIAIGIHAYRKKESSTQNGFFVANRSGSALFIIGSLCATIIGASVTLGMAGRGYRMGLPGAWWLLVGSVGLFILAFFFARTVRRFGLYTLPELVEKQYNSKTAGLVASILIVVAWLAVIAAQIIAAGKILSILLPNVDLSLIMIISALVLILYTFLGGQYSVIRTDLVQFIIIIVGTLACLGLVLDRAGGFSGLHANLPSDYFSFPVSARFAWPQLVTLLILTGSTYVVGPDMYSRLFCARNEKVARASALSAALITIPFAFIIVLIGMGAMALFPDIASQHPNLSFVQASEMAFPTVIKEVLPIGVSGLVIAALLAAMMSSADTCLITTSTILSADIYKRASPHASERKVLIISKLGVILIGAVSLIVALKAGGIINTLLLAYTVFTSGVVLPVVAGFFKDTLKVNSIGAVAAIIGGGGTALAVRQLLHLQSDPLNPKNLIGFGVCAVLLFGVSWITRIVINRRERGAS
jgi:SSS family solute:Na+ symporter